jgi:hypothetical protein
VNLDELAGFVKNPLEIDRIVDLLEQYERELPTESIHDDRVKLPLTRYKLQAVLRYDYRHFLTYAFAPDDNKTMYWAKFDDLEGRVVWEDPVRPVSE